MSISTVAARIGFPLDRNTRKYIQSEASTRRNELLGQGVDYLFEDEIIEEVIATLFNFDSRVTNARHWA